MAPAPFEAEDEGTKVPPVRVISDMSFFLLQSRTGPLSVDVRISRLREWDGAIRFLEIRVTDTEDAARVRNNC